METLAGLNGTIWAGTAELWLDPLGDNMICSECTISVTEYGLRYTWRYEGKEHQGRIDIREDGADFSDSWHQPETMACLDVANAWGLFQVQGEYGSQSDWRWRIGLSFRVPTDELVLQMTNIAPWGEEARAVRMTCKRQ
jgi:hypothetical protein